MKLIRFIKVLYNKIREPINEIFSDPLTKEATNKIIKNVGSVFLIITIIFIFIIYVITSLIKFIYLNVVTLSKYLSKIWKEVK